MRLIYYISFLKIIDCSVPNEAVFGWKPRFMVYYGELLNM